MNPERLFLNGKILMIGWGGLCVCVTMGLFFSVGNLYINSRNWSNKIQYQELRCQVFICD
ncbi:hypothetical protein D1AOALGA4SA_303 [Olavius algarvensis Delta 1 endosymbiont]|nr:hypothetical protein D1AOALGA4SA_303 [Olavius algarvensis Delta 1 endosymbiont]